MVAGLPSTIETRIISKRPVEGRQMDDQPIYNRLFDRLSADLKIQYLYNFFSTFIDKIDSEFLQCPNSRTSQVAATFLQS